MEMSEKVTMSTKTYNELMAYIGTKPLKETYGLFTKVTAEIRLNEAESKSVAKPSNEMIAAKVPPNKKAPKQSTK